MNGKRDFYSEGLDAAIAGGSDIPPSDVSDCGVDAESEWIDGYNSFFDEKEEEIMGRYDYER